MLGEYFGAPYDFTYRIVLVLFLQNFLTYRDKIQILGCDLWLSKMRTFAAEV